MDKSVDLRKQLERITKIAKILSSDDSEEAVKVALKELGDMILLPLEGTFFLRKKDIASYLNTWYDEIYEIVEKYSVNAALHLSLMKEKIYEVAPSELFNINQFSKDRALIIMDEGINNAIPIGSKVFRKFYFSYLYNFDRDFITRMAIEYKCFSPEMFQNFIESTDV